MLFTAIDDRVARDREDSDVTYFNALCLKLEMLTKVVTAAVVSCLEDDPDRHRYRLEHTLVRANSLGDWVSALNDALTGPPAQFLKQEARPLVADLNRRVGRSDWRYQALSDLVSAARSIDAPRRAWTSCCAETVLRYRKPLFEIAAERTVLPPQLNAVRRVLFYKDPSNRSSRTWLYFG